ncbi:hypothetical protein BDV95DRAFT_602291 [Massariosphaeria phaeospora]|uniref:Uncharacterized protein n=1 Tax=Massariosphaeria phaeospora TaxID=100035 RepID=A0A7C8ICQ6_9PLEO|nr:hypothetical protein BDV95DRAFT_602291 [Massariosphaeria phaeospora]
MAASNIPLHCNICPKKPNFSDVSHLLTHISSKGHLSNYYKVKVRSTNEDASRRLIETYDRWYAEWSVEELMSERMTQKDKRRSRARPAGTVLAARHAWPLLTFHSAASRAAPAPKIEAPMPRSTRPRTAVGNLLDPRLSDQHSVKVETSVTPTPPPHPGPVLRHRPFAPHIQYWPTGSRASSRSYTNPDYETSSEYSDPSDRRRYQYTAEESCAIEDEPIEGVPDDTMAVSECTKLKGVYWPGMDIFDSATPEMRRKRNQKKDSSVVEQLELNSQEVEPTELIFTPSGSLKKQRRISSSEHDDEESSPIKVESPRPTLTRPALANMDVNVARRPRQVARAHPFSYLARGHYEDDHGRSDYGHGLDDRASKRRRAFSVFHDDEVSFAQPAPFQYLTAGYSHHPSPTPAPASAFSSYKPFGDPTQYENKENAMPMYHHSAAYDQQQPAQHHPAAGYQYHAYAYGLGQDQPVFQYHAPMYMHNAYQTHNHEDDDQRTLTAPPSPSTG